MHRAPRSSEIAATDGPPTHAAIAAAVVVPLLFAAMYAACGWITADRQGLPVVRWEWERHIPLVPAMIVPYLSLDALLVGSFFLCRTRSELTVHIRRLVLALVVASIAFVAWPLDIGSDRPPAMGIWRQPFEILRAIDKCHNLCPSLHVAVCLIIWPVYARRATQLAARIAVHLGFIAVVVSTLLTYQHHVIDVLAGAVLAAACCATFRQRRSDELLTPRPLAPQQQDDTGAEEPQRGGTAERDARPRTALAVAVGAAGAEDQHVRRHRDHHLDDRPGE
jgi:membrane-associated phospholipid phosphatase